jgi:hypothetical protein
MIRSAGVGIAGRSYILLMVVNHLRYPYHGRPCFAWKMGTDFQMTEEAISLRHGRPSSPDIRWWTNDVGKST